MKTGIVYEDEALLVLHKAAGMAVESASALQPDVVSELKNYLKTTYIGLVHRLDQPVEGLFVVAKTKKAAALLSAQLQSNTLKKSYLALALDKRGDRSPDTFELTDYLKKDPRTKKAEVVKDPSEGKKAALRGRITQRKENDLILCKIQIDTGRFHQIRVQMSHADMPLLADRKYGDRSCMEAAERLGIKNLCLCCDELTIVHPVTKKEMHFSCTPAFLKTDQP